MWLYEKRRGGKGMKKIYINITNYCNVCCPFCCMSSDNKKQTFMTFNTFYHIIENIKESSIIIQLEGGEPTTHPQLYLFLEYIASLQKIEGIVIDTNALTLDKCIDKIIDIAIRNKKTITIKPSFNTYLEKIYDKNHNCYFISYLQNIISACEFIENIKFEINVRGYNNEELEILKNKIPEKIREISNFHLFNRYGRALNDKNLPDLHINKIYDTWGCYASDGKYFGEDLKARAIYESKLL